MVKIRQLETRSRIGDAVEQHALRAEIGNSDLSVRVELAAPLDRVQQKFVERLPDCGSDLLSQSSLQLSHEAFDAFGDLKRTRYLQLHPFGPGGNDFDGERLGCSGERLPHDRNQGRRFDRL